MLAPRTRLDARRGAAILPVGSPPLRSIAPRSPLMPTRRRRPPTALSSLRPRRAPSPAALVLAALAACAPSAVARDGTGAAAPPAASAEPAVDVRLDLAEAEAAAAITEAPRAGRPSDDAMWERLTASAGYRRLAERERSFGRPFTDSAFRAFLASDTLLARGAALAAAVTRWRTLDVRAAAARAAAYLPPGAPLRATLYPVIKPRDNSFVYDLARDPAIFVYVDPAPRPEQLANTLAHELHHVGYNAACRPAEAAQDSALAALRARGGGDSVRAARLAGALTWSGAFGEGIAMLAAAGGPGVHPHAASADSDRVRWDRDVASAPADVARLSDFFTRVLDGGFADDAAVRAAAAEFYGVQGPWYTVGWLMASTVERAHGRPRLVELLCDPPALMAAYDEVAARGSGAAPGAPLPRWPGALLARLRELR